MDLRLFLRVLWRFRLLVLAGSYLAFTLTFLALVRVDPTGSPVLSYRGSETWTSNARLFVTESGFPWGRRLIPPPEEDKSPSAVRSDPDRLTSLAVLYATLANSDPVKRNIVRSGKLKWKISAGPVLRGDGDPLPIIDLSATGITEQSAISHTRSAAFALVKFIREEQQVNQIPDDDRVVIEVIERPTKATLLAGRPKVVPILVFLLVMGATIGLALLLENLRPLPRHHEMSAEPDTEPATRLRLPA
jgi:hypothetical protein